MAFEEDCANGTLADVSFIGTEVRLDEHPAALPAAGAQFLASKLEALAANEELWNSTIFVMNYDENDGFFDHVVPPTPNPKEFPEEFVTLASPAGTPGGGLPIGPGSGSPASSSRPGRWAVISSPRSPTTPPCLQLIEAVAAAGGLSGRARLPSPAPAAGGGRRSATAPGPCARSGAARALEHPVRPRHHRRQPGRADRRPPSAAAAAPGADQQFPVEPRSRRRAHDASRQQGAGEGRRGFSLRPSWCLKPDPGGLSTQPLN